MPHNAETIDHKQMLASLSSAERQELSKKSDLSGLVFLGSHIAAISATAIWILTGAVGWQFALVFHGIQLVFLFTLLHETVHDTPFESKRLNRLVGWLCALIIFLPPTWFRYFHLAHHRYTNDPQNDPELQGGKVQSWSSYLWTVTGLPVWWFHASTIFRNAAGNAKYAFLPEGAREKIKLEARAMIAFYFALFVFAVLLGWLNLLVMLWLLPSLLGQPFLRLYLMAEHTNCPHSKNMFENTRTIFTIPPIRWLAWNMPFHAEHHAMPTVPFHKLPELHAVVNEHLRTTENGYTRFHFKTVQTFGRGKTNDRTDL